MFHRLHFFNSSFSFSAKAKHEARGKVEKFTGAAFTNRTKMLNQW
jgi:hypothetical protein